MPKTGDSVLPKTRVRKEQTRQRAGTSPQGGRRLGEHFKPAPTPKRLSNGSEAKHAHLDYILHCIGAVVISLFVLSSLA